MIDRESYVILQVLGYEHSVLERKLLKTTCTALQTMG